MPLLKTKALPVSDVPNCESWVNGFGGGACSEAEMALRSSETCRVHTSVHAARKSAPQECVRHGFGQYIQWVGR